MIKHASEANEVLEVRDIESVMQLGGANDEPADFSLVAASAFVSGTPAARTVTVAWTVSRQGTAMGARHRDLLYFCPGPTLESCETAPLEIVMIEGAETAALGRTYSRRVTSPLPSVAPGTYHVHLVIDAPDGESGEAVQEADESNNSRAMRVTISGR